MNPDSPFTVHGDETLEARIVAWVLGEASAFEEAELERLCQERPELLVFRHRMRALHGLLTEAEKQQPDEGWKLPEEKRRALDEIFGETKVVKLEVEKEKRVRHTGRKILLAIAASVVIGFVVLSSMPAKYESVATLEVRPRTPGMAPLGASNAELSGARSMSPQFFGTEFEIIKSRNNLEKVVDNLNLQSRWNVDKDTAVAKLKGLVDAENIKGTDLMSIRVRSTNKEDSRDIAEAVAKEYKNYRESLERKDEEAQIAKLRKAVQAQEDKVEERRKVLSTIVRTKGIIYKGSDSFYSQGDVDEDQLAKREETRDDAIKRGLDAQDYVDAKRDFETDQELLQQMKLKLIGEDTSAEMQRETVRIHEKPVEGKKVGPLQSIFGLFGDREARPNADLAAAKSERRVDFLPRTASPAAGEKRGDALAMRDELAALDGVDANGERFRLEASGAMAAPGFAGGGGGMPAVASKKRNPSSGGDSAFRIPEAPADLGQIAGGAPSNRPFAMPSTPIPEEKPQRPAVPSALPKPPATPTQDSQSAGLALQDEDRGISIGRAAIAGKLKPASGTVDLNGRAADGGKPESTWSGVSAESKSAETMLTGTVTAAPARPAEPASAPQPASGAADAETDLVKLMSGGGSGAGISRDQVAVDYGFAGGRSSAGWDASGPQGFSYNLQTDDGKSADGFAGNATGAGFISESPEVENELDLFADSSAMPSLSKVVPSEPEGQSLTNGLRSGDFAITRNSIDAILTDANKGKAQQAAASSSDDSIRSGAAETSELAQSVDAIRKNLYMAEGNLNLGKYDDARKSYEEALKADPYNNAARRGLERVAQAKSDYDRAAYDQTRAELLSQVDSAWEIAVPEEQAKIQAEGETLARNKPDAPELPKVETRAKELSKTPAPITAPAKPDLSKLIEEIAAAEEPYSTFSLNISDASFQIAQAAMAKGERPDPAGVKVEQFYNAVDYGDPAPAAGEPVAVNIEQSAHPVIPGRNLVRVALKTAAAGRAASQPLHLTLLVDQSGSMSREDRRAAMKEALNSLGGLLSNNDRLTVIGFSRTPHLLADGLTGDRSRNLADLVNLEASEGGTNLEEAMKLGGQLAERHKQAGAQNRIVLFTDGAANLGDADPEKLAGHVKQLRQKGIAFDIAGIAAADLNDDLLAELARNGNGRYYVVGKGDDESFAKQLAGAFRPAAENVKVQVRFNPERVSRYKLIGFEKDRLKTEDFRNDAVDAAEMAAEEAGVAIYQIEPIADGKGEIGEVSVRFRDTTAGRMVERSWAISNDPSTPAFDRATPSMQLATFAMLAAEKLKGGAYAEAIDFNQLSAPQANVKQFYGDQGRPAELLRMVDALK